MGLLYELEEQADQKITQQIRQTLQDKLDRFTAMCDECALAKHRHHRYPRSIATKYGVVELSVPVFRCGQCGGMSSGVEVIGESETRKRYSKKPEKKR